jgi:hypothetical protein
MITLDFTRLIEGGSGPLTYAVVNTTPETCDCAVILNATGPVPQSRIVTFQITFSSSLCIEDCEFELRVYDENSCITVVPIVVANPCEDFVLDDIAYSINNGFITFNVTTTGGQGLHIYTWNYTDLGNPAYSDTKSNTGNNTYTFPYSGGGATIQVSVQDREGCLVVGSQDVITCRPKVIESNDYVRFPCITADTNGCVFPHLYAIPCLNRTIDWDTINVTKLVDLATNIEYTATQLNIRWEVEQYPNGVILLCFERLNDFNPIPPGNYRVYWTVKDDLGLESEEGYITVHFADCPDGFDGDNPIVDDCGCASDCEEINEAGEIRIDLGKCILYSCDPDDNPVSFQGNNLPSDDCIDKSTVEILSGPYQVNAVAYYDVYNNELVYIPPVDAEGVDAVVWTAKTLDGESLGLITWNINLNCYDDPEGTSDQACAECCDVIIIDVLENDTPGSPLGWDLTSLEILDPPQYGTAIPLPDGTIQYTAFCNVAGVDTFSYIVADAGTGKYTEAIQVQVEISCAGIEQESVFCSVDDSPIGAIESSLLSNGSYRVTMWGYLENNDPLDSADELDVEFYDVTNDTSIASATLLVGSDNHTPKSGTDDDWTTLIVPYLELKSLTAGALNSTAGVIANFNKKAFALAEGYANTFDANGDPDPEDVAIDIEVRLVVRDMTGPENSPQYTTTLDRVRATIIEDTMYVDQMANPDGNAASVWEWIAPAGTDSIFETSAGDLHPIEDATTWFSQSKNPYNKPPGRIEHYSLSTAPSTELPTGITVDYLNEGGFITQLSTLMTGLGHNLYFIIKPYTELNADFDLVGNNANFFIAYQREPATALNSVRVRYKNITSINVNKVSKATFKNFILY